MHIFKRGPIYCFIGVKILKPQSVVVDSKPDG